MLSYAKLWLLLNEKGMQRTDLTKNKIVSPATLAKLGKNENVNSSVIEKICDFLKCQPGDIMEYISKEDIIKTGQEMNDKLSQLMDIITTTTGMSPEALFEEFMKEAPTMIENIKNGNRDFIGLQDFIDKENNKRA